MKSKFQVDFAGSSYPALYINSRSQAEAVIDRMLESGGLIVADCETAALPQYQHIPDAALSPHLAKPRLFQMFTGKACVVLDLYKTGELPKLGVLFNTRPSVFHNLMFDYKMLKKWHGVNHPDMHCTAIMARCCLQAMYPNRRSASLRDVAKWLFKEDVIKKGGESDWSARELTYEQVHYAAKDVVILMCIYEKLSEYIDKLGLRRCYEVYRRAQLVISQMELNGIGFDIEHHKKNIVSWREKLADAREEVQRITGIGVITDTKIGDWLKANLPEDIIEIWPRTDKNPDRLSVSADSLVNFSHLEIVKPFSEFQKMKKLCTSFGMSLIDQVNPATKRIHSSYTICGARTGRVSCSSPNFQQSPRDKNFRKSFVAAPGKTLIVADYSQLEVRVIAEYAQEERMLQAYEKGLDIYRFTAAHLSGKPYKEIGEKSTERQSAKALVLGLNYGLGAKKFSHYAKKNYDVNLSQEKAYTEVKKYQALYSNLKAWQEKQVNMCIANRYTCFERLGKSNKLSEEKHYGQSMNMPIQGTASSIMYLALIYAEKKLRNTSAQFLATVHDENIIECSIDEAEYVSQVTAECMTEGYSRLMPNARTLKNLVDPGIGADWSSAKK